MLAREMHMTLEPKDLMKRLQRVAQGKETEPWVQEAFYRFERRTEAEDVMLLPHALHLFVRLLQADSVVLESVRGRYVHLLVDECQDVNNTQASSSSH